MKLKTDLSFALGISALVFLFGVGAGAEKRQHEAHVHGVAEVNIAVEGTKAIVEFHSPAESVMGFEHDAKSAADKKNRDAAIATIKQKIGEMVIFEPGLGCKFTAGKVIVAEEREETGQRSPGQQKGGEHREVRADFSIECRKPLGGSRVRFGVTKVFPGIREIKVQVLSDARQSGAAIQEDKGEVRL
jgi:hypothetical protein